jgi:hypothetical protein
MLREVRSPKAIPAWSRPALRVTNGVATKRAAEEPHDVMRAAGVLNLQRAFGNAAATALLDAREGAARKRVLMRKT